MTSLLDAPKCGAVDLIVLKSLGDPGNLVKASFLRHQIRQYESFKEFSPQRLDALTRRLVAAGLIRKKRLANSRSVAFSITKKGVKELASDVKFWVSFASEIGIEGHTTGKPSAEAGKVNRNETN